MATAMAKQDDPIPTRDQILGRARDLIPVLRQRAAQAERDRSISKETIADLQAAGLFKTLQPKRWGGYELDISTHFDSQIALGEGDMSVSWVHGVVGLHPWLVALLDDRAASDIWGEDNTTLICSSLLPAGTAMPDGGGFRLSGRWKYASGCDHCGWVFLGSVVDGTPDDRRMFVVPKRDFQIIDTWHVPGLKATGSQDLVVQDAFVPDYRTQKFSDNFRGSGPGLALNTSPLYRLPVGQILPRGVSSAAIGGLQAMLDAYLEYGKKRIGRGTGTPSSEDAGVRLLCAEAAVAIDEMKLVMHRNFEAMESYARRGELPPLKQRVEYKFHNATVVERCSQLALRLFKAAGTAGMAPEWPFSRILADMNVARQHISNQYEQLGGNYGAFLFGFEGNKDFIL